MMHFRLNRPANVSNIFLNVAGNWLPNCSFDFKPFVISENAPADACSDTIYTCSNPSGKPVSCIDSGSELFRIDCLPNEAKKAKEVRFKFCSLVSLKHRVGQHTVILIVSCLLSEYVMTIIILYLLPILLSRARTC